MAPIVRIFRMAILLSGLFAAYAGHAAPPARSVATPPVTASGAQPAAFTLGLAVNGSELRWQDGRSIVATVTTGGRKATGLVANVFLTDATTLRQFGEGDFQVCKQATDGCSPATDLEPNATQRLYLRSNPSAALHPGKYAGSVQLTANEGKSDSVALTVDYTDDCVRIWGGVLVALGTLVSLGSTMAIRNQLVRSQMINTARIVSRKLGPIEKRLADRTLKVGETSSTDSTIKNLYSTLSTKSMDKESLLPRFYSPDPASFATAPAFKERIDRASAWTIALAHIVDFGFLRVAAAERAMTNPPNTAAATIAAAWTALDGLARCSAGMLDAAPDLKATDAEIDKQVATVEALLPQLGGAAPQSRDGEWVSTQIAVLTLANWMITALLTVALGTYVMVISHPDFGRPSDLFFCAFWGFGLTMAGQVGQATPQSIAASFGITLPK